MNDKDYIKIWLIGVLFITGLVILAVFLVYKADTIVEAAYKTRQTVTR